MTSASSSAASPLTTDVELFNEGLATLYFALLDRWNERDAAGLAALFTEHGQLVGFDGSEINGRDSIETHLEPIFANHPTPTYFAKIRHTRALRPDVALLRAVAGMLPRGATDLNPALNAVHTIVAAQHEGRWLIELFQNTPAAWHGRAHDVEALTQELRALLPAPGPVASVNDAPNDRSASHA